MRAIAMLGLLMVSGCLSASTPATTGMTVAQYQKSCLYGGVEFGELAGMRVAECADKPDEYAIFSGGVVSRVLNSSELRTVLIDKVCASGDRECTATVVQAMAEAEYAKSSKSETARQNDLSARFTRAGAAMSASSQAMQSASPSSTGTMTCFKKSEAVSGFNKICYYDCLGSLTVVTRSSTDLCDLTISR